MRARQVYGEYREVGMLQLPREIDHASCEHVFRRPALANQATVATLTHLIEYCAQQASTTLQEMVIARTATYEALSY